MCNMIYYIIYFKYLCTYFVIVNMYNLFLGRIVTIIIVTYTNMSLDNFRYFQHCIIILRMFFLWVSFLLDVHYNFCDQIKKKNFLGT